jgi:hypothetical protein
MAFAALATLARESAVLVWPATAALDAGLIVGALAAAFYYHFGAWGALEMKGKPNSAISSHIASLRIPTEYATGLTGFARVFFGLGQVVLAFGLFQEAFLPLWIVAGAGTLGRCGDGGNEMVFPDNLEYYMPLFHLNALWLFALGLAVLNPV